MAVGLGGKRLGLIQDLGGRQALAAFLVLTVLICHGAYGAMHQVMTDPGPTMQGHVAQSPHAGNGEMASGGLVSHLAALLFPEHLMAHAGDGGAAAILAYAAALIFVSAVVLSIVIGSPLRWCARPRPDPSLWRLGPHATGRCPPPPSISALQVFRL